jgi:hypothetical protein
MQMPQVDPEALTKDADPEALERLLLRLVDDSVDSQSRLKELGKLYMSRALEKFPTTNPDKYFGNMFMAMYMAWYMKNHAEDGLEMMFLMSEDRDACDAWLAGMQEVMEEKYPDFKG